MPGKNKNVTTFLNEASLLLRFFSLKRLVFSLLLPEYLPSLLPECRQKVGQFFLFPSVRNTTSVSPKHLSASRSVCQLFAISPSHQNLSKTSILSLCAKQAILMQRICQNDKKIFLFYSIRIGNPVSSESLFPFNLERNIPLVAATYLVVDIYTKLITSVSF